MWLLLLFSIMQFTAGADSSLKKLSEKQAEYYLNNIHRGENLHENLLALTMLSSENSGITFHVKEYIEDRGWNSELINSIKELEGSFKGRLERLLFQTGSADLLIALLLEEEDFIKRKKIKSEYEIQFSYPESSKVNYERLVEAIVDRQTINKDILTTNGYHLVHFLILYSSANLDLLQQEYLIELKENLETSTSAFKSESALTNTLHQNSYFRVLYILDKYSQINELYTFLLRDTLFPNSSTRLKIYRYLEYSLYRLGYFDRSLQIVQRFTIPLSEKYSNKSTELSIRLFQGIYYYRIGKLQKAIDIYEKILSISESKNISINKPALYNNLGIAYWKLGNFDKYLNLQLKALEHSQSNKNYSYQLDIFKNLYIYHQTNSDKKNALFYLNQANNLAHEHGEQEDLSKINSFLGAFYRDFEKNYPLAQKYLAQAESLAKDGSNQLLIDISHEKSKLFQITHGYERAIEEQNKIISLNKNENNPSTLEAIINKGYLYLQVNKLDKVSEILGKIKSNDLAQLDFNIIVKAKTVEASYQNKTGHPNDALYLMEPVLEQIMERARNSADIQTGYWNIEPEFLDAFDLVVNILIENNRNEEAVKTLDQLKTINDAALYQSPLVRARTLNESELTRYKQITDQLDNLRKQLLTASDRNRFGIQQTIEQLKLKKRQFDKRFTKFADQEPLGVRSVQNQLSARDLVLHITELKDQYYIAEITRSDISFRTISLDDSLRKHLTDATVQVATHETNLDTLYSITKLLKLDSLPGRFENITVIPDTYFYQLPVDILPIKQPQYSYSYGSTSYLIEKYNINYLSSLNDFRKGREEVNPGRQHRWSYLGYGVSNFDNHSLVPLPFAGTEVRNIASQLTEFSDNHTFINEASSKQAFTSSAPRGRILHLATHSEISEQDPLFSTIYMNEETAKPDDDDFSGQIFAYELFELDLDNDMIMLNSCESGSGSYIQGTGIMGISRALRYAGANALVLNLWSVNDMMASDFAVHFYSELNKGKTKPEALRDTKRHFLKTKNASPHYWGPYMLIGNTDPIVKPNQDTNLIIAGTFMLYFILLSGLSLWINRKKRRRPESERQQ